MLDEGVRSLRDFLKARPLVQVNGPAVFWHRTGLLSVVELPIVISFDYASFDDYWSSFLTRASRIGQLVKTLPAELRAEMQRHVAEACLRERAGSAFYDRLGNRNYVSVDFDFRPGAGLGRASFVG